MRTVKGDSMEASKSHSMSRMWASIVIVIFTAAATIMIVAWSPMLPEALAVEMHDDDSSAMSDFSAYAVLHETESWHYTAVLNELIAIAHCPG